MSGTGPQQRDAWWRRHRRLGAACLLGAVTVGSMVLVLGRPDDDATVRSAPSTSTCTTDGPTSTTSAPPRSTSVVPSSTTTTAVPTTSPPPSTSVDPAPSVVLRRVTTSRPVVVLTFDAGSDAGSTAQILDLLRERGMTANFGLTGCWVEAFPSLAARIVAEGHGVINHTQDHLSFTGVSTGDEPLTTDEREAQVRQAEEVIRSAGADPRPWFRPPYGDLDDQALVDVGRLGYGYTVLWSVDSLGWKGLAPTEVADRIIGGLEPGAIILMHVGSASTDIGALPAILDAVSARGLGPTALADLPELG